MELQRLRGMCAAEAHRTPGPWAAGQAAGSHGRSTGVPRPASRAQPHPSGLSGG